MTPIPDAIGTRTELNGPYNLDVTAFAAVYSAGILTGQTWLAAVGLAGGGITMGQAHLNPSVLYGLLVTEGTFGSITTDALRYHVYFPTGI